MHKKNLRFAWNIILAIAKVLVKVCRLAEDYEENIDQLKNLLKGNLSPVIRHFKEEMKNFAAELAFEKAEITRKKIEYLENYQSRSVVTNVKAGDLDVFSL